MMFKHNLQLFSLIVGGAIAFSAPVFNLPAFSQDANAQNCLQALDYNPATTTTRSVELEQFGIRITIPSTYRTMLHNDGTVGIYPPGSYLHLQCLAKGFEVLGTDVILGETLTLRPNPEDLTLDEFAAKRKEEFLKRENFIATAELSQQQIQGIDVVFMDGRGPIESFYAWYEAPEVDGTIEINAADKAAILKLLSQAELLKAETAQTLPAELAVGSNPIDVALTAVKAQGYSLESFKETIERQNDSAENPQSSTVVITQEGLLDDSVRGQRFTVLLDKDAAGAWVVTDIQESWLCHQGRGSQTYSQELCI